jgi:lysozyme
MGLQAPVLFHQNALLGPKAFSYMRGSPYLAPFPLPATKGTAMLNAVIDISHHNGKSLDFEAARAAGILGVIHKASQGPRARDAMYEVNKTKARDAGLLWGAYHFATGSDGVKQAENFLDAVGDPEDVLMALDLESNPTGRSMSLSGAHEFVTHVFEQTGRWPGLYSGHTIKELLGARKDPILANCWLWLAQYGPRAVVPPNWPTWTLWQYTDGAVGGGPKSVAGIGRCDRDRFNGPEANLRKLWRGG